MAKGISIHIGVNAVDPNHYGGWSGQLTACENDALSMQEIARAQGFQSQLLLTKNATADAILGAIKNASTKLDTGDMLFVSASLHGGQIMDEDRDEYDNIDETWCAYDREIIDDELGLLWQAFKPGVRIIVLSDSCHSGTVLKVNPLGVLRPEKVTKENSRQRVVEETEVAVVEEKAVEGVRARALPTDISLKTYHMHKALYDDIKSNIAKSKDSDNIKAHVKLISGCQDNQTSLDGSVNGAFTTSLLLTWDDGKFTGDYEKFHSLIQKKLPNTQSPNLYNVGVASPAFDKEKPFVIG